MADDDLDALLDDALDTYGEAAKEEELRQEKRKEKQQQKTAGEDDELTGLLESTLATLQGEGADSKEDQDLQELVKQGLSLMKGDVTEGNEQEMLKKCLGLLDTMSKDITTGADGGDGDKDPMAGMNPFMKQLSQTVGDVVKSLEECTDGEASTEDQSQLLDMIKNLDALKGGLGTGGDEMKGIEDLLKDHAGGGGAFAEMLKKEVEKSLEDSEGETVASTLANLKKELDAVEGEEMGDAKVLLSRIVSEMETEAAAQEASTTPSAPSAPEADADAAPKQEG